MTVNSTGFHIELHPARQLEAPMCFPELDWWVGQRLYSGCTAFLVQHDHLKW